MAVDRKRLQVGAVAAVIVAAMVWYEWPASAPGPATNAPATRPRAQAPTGKKGTPRADSESVEVKLKALRFERDEPGGGARNPFRFQPKPAPAPPRPIAPPVEAPRPVAPPVPAGPPPPPPIPLKFIGVLERANGVKWAVLTDGKSGTMFGKDGDIIDGRYVIVKIGAESIEMTYADGRGRQVLRLTGQ